MNKKEHSMFSNIFYFLKVLFRLEPWLVVFECFTGVIQKLPTRLVSVIGLKYIIDAVSNHDDTSKIVKAVIVIGISLLCCELFNWIYRDIFFRVGFEKVDSKLSMKLYDKARELDLQSYDDPNFYNNFIMTIESTAGGVTGVLGLVNQYVGEFISLITIASILLTIDPICLLIILVIVAIFTPISRKIGHLQAERQIENNKYHRRADYFARVFYLQDYCKEVKMNNIKDLLVDRYKDAADDVIANQKKYVSKIDFIYFFQESGVGKVGFMFILPLYLGYCVIEKRTLSVGDFVATFNGAFAIATAFNFMTVTAARTFSERARLIGKYREFLSCESSIKDGDNIAENNEPKTISIENLSFTYPGNDKPTINNINLEIKPYEKIALVGYNGAGKTTLTNLMLRLYDVSDGSIKIDGKDIRETTISSHRDRFSAVFQDFQLFATSIGENVSLDNTYEKQRVLDALDNSGFDKELKKGLETPLLREFRDDGIMLSGGESQKVAIARAFYKKCPYVILDEPSANLDPIAEYSLNQAIIEGAKDKTVIFISHRLSTTINADKIYVMENGEIIESGNHEELMKLNGTYAYMFNLQAEKYKLSNN